MKKYFPHLTNIKAYSTGDIIAQGLLIFFAAIGIILSVFAEC